MKRDIFVEKKVTVCTLQHFSILVAGCQNEAGNAVQCAVDEREIYNEPNKSKRQKTSNFLKNKLFCPKNFTIFF